MVARSASRAADGMATASVSLKQQAGSVVHTTSEGDGPVDAVFKAIERITDLPVRLREYQVSSASFGGDAQGEVSVEVEHQERSYRGHGVSTDIILASAHAYLEAINRVAAYGHSARAARKSRDTLTQAGGAPPMPSTLLHTISHAHLVAPETSHT